MNLYLLGVIWVVGAAALAGIIAVLVHRLRSSAAATSDASVVGTVFTLVGGLHAVVMVFVLIALFDAAGTARADSFREADGLVAISWAADSLPEPSRTQIHTLTRSYSDTVINDEWPSMQAGEEPDRAGWAQLDELRLAIERSNPTDDWQQERRSEAATQFWEVYQARQDRLNAGSGGVTVVVWLVLIIGSVATMALAYLYGETHLVTHIVAVSAMAGTIALLLFAIYQMQNPFSGGASVDPYAFQLAQQRLTQP